MALCDFVLAKIWFSIMTGFGDSISEGSWK
jgi:hypothetical protein